MNILWTICIFIIALKVGAGIFLQTTEVNVLLGESVVLPCNGSGIPVDELQIRWEAMGQDVISLHEGELSIGGGFEERVNFITDPTETQDFSIILTDAMFNDAELYECLWEGTKPICSVLVNVQTPPISTDSLEAFEGDDITLDCFGSIPKNRPWDNIYIQWIKDEEEILRLSSGEMEVLINYSIITLPPKKDIYRGIFSLTISSVSVYDQGSYQCRYKSLDYGDPESGFPKTIVLTVWAVYSGLPAVTDSFSGVSESSSSFSSSFPTQTSTVSTETEAGSTMATATTATAVEWASTYPTSATTEFNKSPTGYTHDANTETTEETHTERHTTLYSPVMTDLLLRKMTTVSVKTDVLEMGTVSGQPDHPELIWDEQIRDQQFPWICIGLIAGVLVITVLVLAVLRLSGKI